MCCGANHSCKNAFFYFSTGIIQSKNVKEGKTVVEFREIFGVEKKQKYGMGSNIWFHMKETKKWDKKLFYYQWLCVLPNVAASFLGTLLPAELLRGLENGWHIKKIAVEMILLTLLMWICRITDSGMNSYLRYEGKTVSFHYIKKCFHKIMDLDYDQLEQEQKKAGNAWKALKDDYNFTGMMQSFSITMQAVFGILGYGFLLVKNSIWILLVTCCSLVFHFFLLSLAKKKHRFYHVHLSSAAKEAAYLSRQSMESAAGKDIRIYQMADWLLKKYQDV